MECGREDAELKDIKEQLLLYAKENERLVNELRNLRHTTLNIMQGINGYIELEDWDGLKEFFHDILEEIKNTSNTNLSSIEKILNPLLKELLYSKLKNATGTGIDIKVMVDEIIFIDNNLISEADLCKVINEFLDNAIEWASEASQKKVSICFLINKESVSIIIENTFKERPNMLLKNTAASKAEGREPDGQSAGVILSRYPDVLNNTFIQHQVFVQELQIIKQAGDLNAAKFCDNR
jgi:two-component system sensor histidine kinase AgrC